jgi:hypothetical protein
VENLLDSPDLRSDRPCESNVGRNRLAARHMAT